MDVVGEKYTDAVYRYYRLVSVHYNVIYIYIIKKLTTNYHFLYYASIEIVQTLHVVVLSSQSTQRSFSVFDKTLYVKQKILIVVTRSPRVTNTKYM